MTSNGCKPRATTSTCTLPAAPIRCAAPCPESKPGWTRSASPASIAAIWSIWARLNPSNRWIPAMRAFICATAPCCHAAAAIARRSAPDLLRRWESQARARLGRSIFAVGFVAAMHQGADRGALHNALQIAGAGDVVDPQRDAGVSAQRDRGGIHHLQVACDHIVVGQGFEASRVLLLLRVGVVHAV